MNMWINEYNKNTVLGHLQVDLGIYYKPLKIFSSYYYDYKQRSHHGLSF